MSDSFNLIKKLIKLKKRIIIKKIELKHFNELGLSRDLNDQLLSDEPLNMQLKTPTL